MGQFMDKRANAQQAATFGTVLAWAFLVVGGGAAGSFALGPGGGLVFAMIGGVAAMWIGRCLRRWADGIRG